MLFFVAFLLQFVVNILNGCFLSIISNPFASMPGTKSDYEKSMNRIDDELDEAKINNLQRCEKNTIRITMTKVLRLRLLEMCEAYDTEHWKTLCENDDDSAYIWLYDKKIPCFQEMCYSGRPLTIKEWVSADDLARLTSKYVETASEKPAKTD